uniref:Diacylglycerol kinase n=1 Tax=Rhabditophanes sp. KR3021 TaxID=114890 RepID=A0AC35U751_9BILA
MESHTLSPTSNKNSEEESLKNISLAQRSKSAPQRRKWFQKALTQRSSTSFLTDRVVSARLVGAITIWHDIHSNLIQLDVSKNTLRKTRSVESNISNIAHSDSFMSLNEDSLNDTSLSESSNSLPDFSGSETDSEEDDVGTGSKKSNATISQLGAEEIHTNIDSITNDDSLVDSSKFLSTNNSQLNKEQLKAMFPELSDHWRKSIVPEAKEDDFFSNYISSSPTFTTDGEECHDNLTGSSGSVTKKKSVGSVPTANESGESLTGPDNGKRKFSLARIALKKLVYAKRADKSMISQQSDSVVQYSSSNSLKREHLNGYDSFLDENQSPTVSDSAIMDSNLSLHLHKSNSNDESLKRHKIISNALRSSGAKIRRSVQKKKKSLGPSLSWDPNGMLRGGSLKLANSVGKKSQDSNRRSSFDLTETPIMHPIINSPNKCYHCALLSEYQTHVYKTEIESAVKQLAQNIGEQPYSAKVWSFCESHDKKKTNNSPIIGGSINTGDSSTSTSMNIHARSTPDIIVSSMCSEDEENEGLGKSSEPGSSMANSITSSPATCSSPTQTFPMTAPQRHTITDNSCVLDGLVSVKTQAMFVTSDHTLIDGTPLVIVESEKSPEYEMPEHNGLSYMDSLKPPNSGLLSATNGSCSPPRSNSIDLSTLRRDIELLSVSSNDSDGAVTDYEWDCPTPAESVRTIRSRSYDPSSSTASVLRRPSKIEHLSDIFRKALAKSPVVRRAAALHEQNVKAISKHRTTRYWLSNDIHPNEHKEGKKRNFGFIVKPTEIQFNSPKYPLLVFVNPKSGGNKGAKALHTFCWILNPRQVFDITAMKGPKFGLEVFRKIGPRMRILVCGGDGTVGWVLSTLDELNWPAYPAMALMPLGTGNDLSRCMGWGGLCTDEPLSNLLEAILFETSVTYLDRWKLKVQPNLCVPLDSNDELSDATQSSLPLTVMNNYFSIGADAHVALQFHHSRSANPQMLNSRLKNRIAYGGLGTIDLFKRTWKDLTEYVDIECDGVNITQKLKDFKFHCVLFHNITYYGGGTMPWGNDETENFGKQSSCDGKIEVLGFTSATLAALQMGGKGERIAQCSSARITTTKPIPMQVDGEPCLLAPSTISLSFHSKVPMLKRNKKTSSTPGIGRKNKNKVKECTSSSSTSVIMQIPVIVIGRQDYEMFRESLDRLKDTAFEIGLISVESESELSVARFHIQKMLQEHPSLPYEPEKEWQFIDYITLSDTSNSEEGTFRVSKKNETIQSLSDICNVDDCVIILDEAFPSMTDRSQEVNKESDFTPTGYVATSQFSNNEGSLCSSDYDHPSPTQYNRRISEALRIVLSSDQQETHL